MKRIICLICVCICFLLTLACGGEAQPEPPAATAEAPTAERTELPTASPEPLETLHVEEPADVGTVASRLMDEESIEAVQIEPDMMSNADIATLIAMFPHVIFRYAVKIGDAYFPPGVTELSIEEAEIGEIADALPCLPSLKTVHLGACKPEDIPAIQARLPGIELTYTLLLYDREVAPDVQTLDLSDLETLSPDALNAALPFLPALKTVTLGVRDDREAAEAFKAAVPSVECEYTYRFTFLGQTLTDDVEALDLSKTKITDLDELKKTIDMLPALSRIEMIDCGLSDETMAILCDTYPNIKFVWELNLGYWGKLRTDATAFSTRYSKSEKADKNRLSSEDAQYIRYCTDLVALDLGHQRLTDISFLRPLKKLRVLILADSYISDISVLGELPELEYIELFMNRVEDVSPLAKLEKLTDLNICSNKVSNFKPLCSIKTLKRLWYTKNDYSSKDHQMLQEALPDCVLNHNDVGTDGGWRYSGKEKSEREKWKNAFFEGAPRYV